MSDFPRMIYRAGGTEEIHGGRFDWIIVEDAQELAAALADGWHLTTDEARDAAAPKVEAVNPAPTVETPDDAAPTRAELEQKAHELGIEFSPRLGDAKLAERIEAALAKG
jgi:hypothetical protein